MAPQTVTRRFMLSFRLAPLSLRRCLAFSLILLVAARLVPHAVLAASLAETPARPDLTSFSAAVQNGDGSTLRGVYAEDIFAAPVVQQPSCDAAFVSPATDVLTQFSAAAQYGNIGLLAHNYLTGQYFSRLVPGQGIQLIYGDGRTEGFMVTHIYRYQATSPSSPYSDFIDLDAHEYSSASALFAKVYTGERHITFQTCIEANGDLSWGRLFVIAEPERPRYPLIHAE